LFFSAFKGSALISSLRRHNFLSLALAVASGTFIAASGGPALAACTPGGNVNNQTITCSNTLSTDYNAGDGADTLNFLDGTTQNAGVTVRADPEPAFTTGYPDTINFKAGAPVSAGITLNGRVIGNEGNDTINIEQNASVLITATGILAGNEGVDDINIDGTLTINDGGELNAGDNGDTIDISGIVTNGGFFRAGDGDNTVTILSTGILNNGSTGRIASGTGDDKYIINGTLNNGYEFNSGGGNDTITVNGRVNNTGNFRAGDGGDQIIIQGEFINTGAGSIIGGIGQNTITVLDGGLLQTASAIDLLGNSSNLVNGGTLRIGGTGAMTVTNLTGNFQQQATGRLSVDVDLANSTSDQMLVSGTAELYGIVDVNLLSSTLLSRQITLLTSQGTLTDAGLELAGVSNTQVITYGLSATDHDLLLDVTVDFVTDDGKLTENQTALGAYFNDVAADSSGPFAGLLTSLAGISGAADYRNALDQLMGAEYAQHLQSVLWSTRGINRVVTERMECGSDGGAYAQADGSKVLPAADAFIPATGCFEPGRLALWARGFGSWNSLDGDSNAPGFEETQYGLLFGADYSFEGNWFMGLTGGYFDSEGDFDDFGARSGAGIDYHGLQLAAYGGYDDSIFYVRGILAYGNYDGESTRLVDEPGGITGQLTGDPSSNVMSFYGETGYRFALGSTGHATPFAGLSVAGAHLDGFTERDSDATGAALEVSDAEANSLATVLGLRLDAALPAGTGLLLPELSLAWSHEFGDTRQDLEMSFAGAPAGSSFDVEGSDVARDSLLVDAGAKVQLSGNLEVGVFYNGWFSSDYTSNAVAARLGVSF
jgi:outer membrane autotransporter protein